MTTPHPDPQQSEPAIQTFTDRKWRLENLYFIKDRHGNVVKFKLNRAQTKLLAHLHSRNIILKARQLGCSTFIAILFLDGCLWNENISAAIVADKLENGKNIFKKVEFAWTMFPRKLKDTMNLLSTSDSTSEMAWTNGSVIKVGTTLHSGTHQYLHISEYGPLCNQSPEKAEDIKKSALPTVPHDGGLVFIESTAEGEQNDFHSMVVDAQETTQRAKTTGKPLLPMQYFFHFFAWFEEDSYRVKGEPGVVPMPRAIERYLAELEKTLGITLDQAQKNWYALTAKDLKDRMKEQHPSTPDEAFLSSGSKQFDPEIIAKKIQEEVREPIGIDGDLFMYTAYKRGHSYAIGADVADGVGLDSSTAVVIDFTTNEIVATYKSNTIDPVNFAFDLARIGNQYGVALIAPENARTGHTVCVKLQEMYSNLYQFEMLGYSEVKQTIRLGWSTTTSTKPRMMSELKAAFEDEEKPLLCPDITILREARGYSKEDNLMTTSAQILHTTKHNDLLIAAAIAWQMRNHASATLVNPVSQDRMNKLREKTLAGERRYR